jgi:hypothetical protein
MSQSNSQARVPKAFRSQAGPLRHDVKSGLLLSRSWSFHAAVDGRAKFDTGPSKTYVLIPVSRIVADYFEKLESPPSEQTESITPKVAALRGILKGTGVEETDYYGHLEEKHG